jgi:hypothetical protein
MSDQPLVEKVYRSSYSPTNALRWIAFFNAAIETNSDKVIPFKNPGDPGFMKPQSLKNRVTDAFKWLCENDLTDFLEDRDKNKVVCYPAKVYAELRGKTTLRTLPGTGVLLEFGGRVAKKIRLETVTPAYETVDYNRKVNDSWKEDLLNYLQSDDTEMFHRNNLTLGPADIDYVHKACAGLEVKTTSASITVIK